MDTSVFTNKTIVPEDQDLSRELNDTSVLWHAIRNHVHGLYPDAMDEWHYSGVKYGWSFRIKDKKRVIVYLLPREGFFKTAFVFGQKATDVVMESTIAPSIKELLKSAKVYAEGRGIRIDILDSSLVDDVKQLIEVKLKN
ncbi:DUF3788 domain-containing protein [Fluviicola taffensis]|uniref:DUF3788 domain-containing protein n=1 Tax=Fluviicola taffensis TaxID=191579 RepID=UPI0031378E97